MKTTTMILGTAAILIAVALNFRHALDDYGVRNNNLHMEILAQSNSVGGGNGSNVGGGGGGIPDGGGSTGGGGGSNGGGGDVVCRTHENRYEISSIDCDGNNKPEVVISDFSCISGYSGSCKDGSKTTYYDCKGEIRSSECYDTTYCR